MRQKIRKAVAALSRGQLLRVDQTVAFDVNEPPYLPDVRGACCTTGGAEDGTFCQCSDNVLGRDCCLQGGIHFPEAVCADVTCCEPGPDCFGAFCNNAPGTPAQCVEGTRSNPPEGDFVFQGCGSDCSTTTCPEPETINRCCKKCGDGYVDPNALNGECEAFQGMSSTYCDKQNGVFTENATCEDSGVCEDACVEAVENACCYIGEDLETGELVTKCVSGNNIDQTVCDILNGIFSQNTNCDANPCSETVQVCCVEPTVVSAINCPGFEPTICRVDVQCSKSIISIDDLETDIGCCSPGDNPLPDVTLDCSCDASNTSACSNAIQYSGNQVECQKIRFCDNGLGNPSTTDCCDVILGPGTYGAVLECEGCP